MSSSVDAPPPANPVLTAYQGFVSTTPLVTRYVISLVCVSYVASWFADPNMALANIPLFTIQKLELYRMVTAPLLCDSLLNLVFAYLSFVENGKRLEYAMGSGAFASLLGVLASVTNLIHIVFCYTVYFLTKQEAALMYPASSIWIVVLALIAAECSKAPRDSKRKLFVVQVPTLYYRE
jgi:membrane associated rhomboid family serine protease